MTAILKVDTIQDTSGNNIINESSNTITIGKSGDAVNLASGATQTGFGRTGTVNWQTSSIKTSTFTATSGEGYFVNTTGVSWVGLLIFISLNEKFLSKQLLNKDSSEEIACL